MDRVFLDANVLFSAAYKPTSRLRELWTLPNTTLLSSPYAVAETELNLTRVRVEAVTELQLLLGRIEVAVTQGVGELPEAAELAEKDKPILLAAISAKATHLLTGDKLHFGYLFGISVQGVLVLPPSEYLNRRPVNASPSQADRGDK